MRRLATPRARPRRPRSNLSISTHRSRARGRVARRTSASASASARRRVLVRRMSMFLRRRLPRASTRRRPRRAEESTRDFFSRRSRRSCARETRLRVDRVDQSRRSIGNPRARCARSPSSLARARLARDARLAPCVAPKRRHQNSSTCSPLAVTSPWTRARARRRNRRSRRTPRPPAARPRPRPRASCERAIGAAPRRRLDGDV